MSMDDDTESESLRNRAVERPERAAREIPAAAMVPRLHVRSDDYPPRQVNNEDLPGSSGRGSA